MWTKEKSKFLMRDLRDITDAVERLDEGVCQLEAKQLAMLNAPYTSREMRGEANYLTAMNNSTAEWIQATLKKVEGTVRMDMEGAEGTKELLEEFIKVLRGSVRVLNEYRLVQETYVNELNRCVSISDYDPDRTSGNQRNGGGRILNRLALFLRSRFCSCA